MLTELVASLAGVVWRIFASDEPLNSLVCLPLCSLCPLWQRIFALVLGHVLPAVDFEDLAGHVTAELLGREKQERTRAFVRGTEAVHGNAGLEAFEHLR